MTIAPELLRQPLSVALPEPPVPVVPVGSSVVVGVPELAVASLAAVTEVSLLWPALLVVPGSLPQARRRAGAARRRRVRQGMRARIHGLDRGRRGGDAAAVLASGWWLLWVLAGPGGDGSVDRRAACMERNAGAPTRYRGVVRALCAEHVNLGGVGASVAIAEGGALRFVATAGQRCAGGAAVTAETGFRVGSLTKLVTAALALTEVDAGRMALDGELVTWLPELLAWDDRRAERISLRALLTHSSGLGELQPWAAPGDEWIDGLGERRLATAPGELWSYSNAGYALVGAALERGTGERFAGLAAARVLRPLGLRRSTLVVTEALAGEAACGHLGRGSAVMAMNIADDLEIGAGLGLLAGGVEAAKRAFGAASQADQAVGVLGQFVKGDLRQVGRPGHRPVDVEPGVEPHQVHVAALVLRQKDDGRRQAGLLARLGGVVGDADLAADDGLDPGTHCRHRKLQRGEHVVGVGDGNCGHSLRRAEADKFLHRHRAFEKRVFGVGPQMDESGV